MKKQTTSLILCTVLLVGLFVPFAFANVSLSNRFDAVGNYGMITAGVGLNEQASGDLIVDVPGNVVAAYFYWAGVDTKPGGDNTAVFNGADIIADFSIEEQFWYMDSVEYYHYVYVKDVSSMINTGGQTYTISGNDEMIYPYGAGLVVVYEDSSLPLVRVVLMDGADGFHFFFEGSNGPNSELTCFDFDSATSDRDAEMFLMVGGNEHDNRPNKIWTQTGSGANPLDLITTPTGVGGPYPLVGADGPAWDTYTDNVAIAGGDEWLCVQIESIISEGSGWPDFDGRGTSALLIATGFMLPVETGLDGLSPGFWKHNIRVALEYPGRYSVPHEGEDRMNYNRILGLAEAATGKTGIEALEDALEALTAKGPGSESIRLDMANAFNAAAGYQPYSD